MHMPSSEMIEMLCVSVCQFVYIGYDTRRKVLS